ncbi:erythropoietin [Bombina bombina]|uniref:erythropoietin n=1 Tax=Bombina bombina TaxID=8345 RepID=UPI00235AC029|nr:erythropoietin [Bombina bombina]
MGVTGLPTLLLMLLVNVKIVMLAPAQPVCDSHILDRYIKEAREMETAMDSIQFPEDITVPETKLNPALWKKLNKLQQAADVWKGLNLFTKAIQRIRDFITDATVKFSVDKSYSNIRSISQLFKRLNIQDETQTMQSEESTLSVRTLKKFFSVYTNFLRGKCKLLLIEICREDICIEGSCKSYS